MPEFNDHGELDALLSTLKEHRIVYVVGMPGTGKSTWIRECVAHANLLPYPLSKVAQQSPFYLLCDEPCDVEAPLLNPLCQGVIVETQYAQGKLAYLNVHVPKAKFSPQTELRYAQWHNHPGAISEILSRQSLNKGGDQQPNSTILGVKGFAQEYLPSFALTLFKTLPGPYAFEDLKRALVSKLRSHNKAEHTLNTWRTHALIIPMPQPEVFQLHPLLRFALLEIEPQPLVDKMTLDAMRHRGSSVHTAVPMVHIRDAVDPLLAGCLHNITLPGIYDERSAKRLLGGIDFSKPPQEEALKITSLICYRAPIETVDTLLRSLVQAHPSWGCERALLHQRRAYRTIQWDKLSHTKALGDTPSAESLYLCSLAHLHHRDFESAFTKSQDAFRHSTPGSPQVGFTGIRAQAAFMAMNSGKAQGSRDALESMLNDEKGSELEVNALGYLGNWERRFGNLYRAESFYKKAISLGARFYDSPVVGVFCFDLMICYALMNLRDAACRYGDRASETRQFRETAGLKTLSDAYLQLLDSDAYPAAPLPAQNHQGLYSAPAALLHGCQQCIDSSKLSAPLVEGLQVALLSPWNHDSLAATFGLQSLARAGLLTENTLYISDGEINLGKTKIVLSGQLQNFVSLLAAQRSYSNHQFLSTQAIGEALWPELSSRSSSVHARIRVAANKLREKFGAENLESVRHQGYRLGAHLIALREP